MQATCIIYASCMILHHPAQSCTILHDPAPSCTILHHLAHPPSLSLSLALSPPSFSHSLFLFLHCFVVSRFSFFLLLFSYLFPFSFPHPFSFHSCFFPTRLNKKKTPCGASNSRQKYHSYRRFFYTFKKEKLF